MEHIALKGQTVAVELSGAGRPLVLLHGLGADHRQVVSALLAPDGYRCVCPDMPGHGDTPLAPPPAGAGFRTYAALVRALLDELGMPRAVLGGISMGAATALRVALDAPDRVAGLILIRPSWLDQPAPPHLAIVGRVGRWQQQAPHDAEARLEADVEYREILAANPAVAQSVHGLLTRPQALEAARVLDLMVADRPLRSVEELAAVCCKSLVIANDGDPLHPVRIAQAIADRLPQSRLELVPSRYLKPAEHLAALRAAVSHFLDQLGEF